MVDFTKGPWAEEKSVSESISDVLAIGKNYAEMIDRSIANPDGAERLHLFPIYAMYESGIYQPLSYNEHILPLVEVVAMLYRNMEDRLETVGMKSMVPVPTADISYNAMQVEMVNEAVARAPYRVGMEIVKQAEAIGMTAIISRLSLTYVRHNQFSQFVSASLGGSDDMIVSMIYKSAIENGTADVLLDLANACDIAEAEGVELENGLPPGVPNPEEWSLIPLLSPSYKGRYDL